MNSLRLLLFGLLITTSVSASPQLIKLSPKPTLDPLLYNHQFFYPTKSGLIKSNMSGQTIWHSKESSLPWTWHTIKFNRYFALTKKGALISIETQFGTPIWGPKYSKFTHCNVNYPKIQCVDIKRVTHTIDFMSGQKLKKERHKNQSRKPKKQLIVSGKLHMSGHLTGSELLIKKDDKTQKILRKLKMPKSKKPCTLTSIYWHQNRFFGYCQNKSSIIKWPKQTNN